MLCSLYLRVLRLATNWSKKTKTFTDDIRPDATSDWDWDCAMTVLSVLGGEFHHFASLLRRHLENEGRIYLRVLSNRLPCLLPSGYICRQWKTLLKRWLQLVRIGLNNINVSRKEFAAKVMPLFVSFWSFFMVSCMAGCIFSAFPGHCSALRDFRESESVFSLLCRSESEFLLWYYPTIRIWLFCTLTRGANLLHLPPDCARNYRPCFRENQPKRSFSIKWKRAFWACFRENWVYKFGHRAPGVASTVSLWAPSTTKRVSPAPLRVSEVPGVSLRGRVANPLLVSGSGTDFQYIRMRNTGIDR
jgi:hypothetical protein